MRILYFGLKTLSNNINKALELSSENQMSVSNANNFVTNATQYEVRFVKFSMLPILLIL